MSVEKKVKKKQFRKRTGVNSYNEWKEKSEKRGRVERGEELILKRSAVRKEKEKSGVKRQEEFIPKMSAGRREERNEQCRKRKAFDTQKRCR